MSAEAAVGRDRMLSVALDRAPVVILEHVSRTFSARGEAGGRRAVEAVRDVTLAIAPGESLAVVGRSGAGKSTLARLIVGLERPDTGRVRVLGRDLATLRGEERRAVLTRIGVVAQDPYAALSPSTTVLDIVDEPLRIARVAPAEARERAAAALADVGLDDRRLWTRSPDELSGGERQRVGVARAIANRPVLLLADEPTSMLDAPRQQELLALLAGVRAARSLALLFITHDLALAAEACERTAVIDAGRVVETGPTAAVLADPADPATRALVAAARARTAWTSPVGPAARQGTSPR